jgi:hypothetical protein
MNKQDKLVETEPIMRKELLSSPMSLISSRDHKDEIESLKLILSASSKQLKASNRYECVFRWPSLSLSLSSFFEIVTRCFRTPFSFTSSHMHFEEQTLSNSLMGGQHCSLESQLCSTSKIIVFEKDIDSKTCSILIFSE